MTIFQSECNSIHHIVVQTSQQSAYCFCCRLFKLYSPGTAGNSLATSSQRSRSSMYWECRHDIWVNERHKGIWPLGHVLSVERCLYMSFFCSGGCCTKQNVHNSIQSYYRPSAFHIHSLTDPLHSFTSHPIKATAHQILTNWGNFISLITGKAFRSTSNRAKVPTTLLSDDAFPYNNKP